MKTYYSIISVSPNPALNEKFNVGLLCVTPKETYFHFSKAKFRIISKLLSPQAAKLALAALEGMEAKICVQDNNNSLLFTKESLPMVAEPYINYLHRYNNNLVQFTSTIELDLEMTQPIFEQLFRKYIFSEELFSQTIVPKSAKFNAVRNQFRRLAKPFANTNFSVSKQIIPDLVVPVTVDVFGKNGAFVTGQAMDFEKQFTALQHDLSSYLYLVEHTKKADSHSTCYLLGDEPSKQEKQNHELWKNIRQSGLIQVIPVEESERIIQFMKEKDVKPVM